MQVGGAKGSARTLPRGRVSLDVGTKLVSYGQEEEGERRRQGP